MDWSKISYFKASEFPESPDKYASERLIETLDIWREFLGHRIYPSPAPGALARLDGDPNSRHYAVGRLSDAVDVFPDCGIREAWLAAIRSQMWGGIGVYFDTHFKGKPWPMLHLDLRPGATAVWYRSNGQYGSPMNNPSDLQKLFGLLNAV